MDDNAKKFWLAMLAIVLIAVAYEVYKPLGLSLFVIAVARMVLSGGSIL